MNFLIVGKYVYKRRKELGITQKALAKSAGISRSYISAVENGKITNVTLDLMNRLSTALGMDFSGLGQDSPEVDAVIPPALQKLAIEDELPFDEIQRLLQIPRPGREPRTVDDWRWLYTGVRRFIRKRNDFPEPLMAFVGEKRLGADILQRLSRIPAPRSDPETKEEWEELYISVASFIEEPSEQKHEDSSNTKAEESQDDQW